MKLSDIYFYEHNIKREKERLKLNFIDGYTVISYYQLVEITSNFYNYVLYEFNRAQKCNRNMKNKTIKIILRFENNIKDNKLDYTSKMILIKMSKDKTLSGIFNKNIIDYSTQELYLQKKIYLVIDLYLIIENFRRVENICKNIYPKFTKKQSDNFHKKFLKDVLPNVKSSLQKKKEVEKMKNMKNNIETYILEIYPDYKNTIKQASKKYMKDNNMSTTTFCNLLGIRYSEYYSVLNNKSNKITRRLKQLLIMVNFLYSEGYLDKSLDI